MEILKPTNKKTPQKLTHFIRWTSLRSCPTVKYFRTGKVQGGTTCCWIYDSIFIDGIPYVCSWLSCLLVAKSVMILLSSCFSTKAWLIEKLHFLLDSLPLKTFIEFPFRFQIESELPLSRPKQYTHASLFLVLMRLLKSCINSL